VKNHTTVSDSAPSNEAVVCSKSSASCRKILLVDDEAIVAMAEAKVLQENRYDVIIAHSGERAVDAIKADSSIDIVLMDIDLGKGISGTEAAKQILVLRNLPIVFLTSHSEKEMVEKVLGITRYGYVIKDSGDFVLLSSIEMAFELFEAHIKTGNSEERYRSILNASPDSITITDLEGRILMISPSGVKMFGFEHEEEWLSRMILDFLDPEDRKLALSNLKLMSTGVFPGPGEYRAFRADGSRFEIEVNGEFIRDAEGHPTNMVFIVRDITRRKQAEEALKQSEGLLNSIIDQSPTPTWISDEKGTLMRINRACCELLNITEEDVIGKYNVLEDNIVIEQGFLPAVREVFEKGTIARFTMHYEASKLQQLGLESSKFVIIDVTIFPIMDNKGRVSNAVIQHTDITERRLAEEKIESLLAEKEMLLKEVHHRIKNNMNIIMSLLSLQARTLHDPEAVSSLKDAKSRINSMMLLYDKLYQSSDFREISTKEYLTTLIDEIVGMFPGMECVAVEKHIDDFILGVNTLFPLGIILNEVLTNAMRHAFNGRDKGRIIVSLSLSDRHATLIIEDNGIGIPESIDGATSTGFGFQLIGMLIEQLDGGLRLEQKNGTRCVLEFDI
jgi:two-component system, sensor histidine kinase PdtaS